MKRKYVIKSRKIAQEKLKTYSTKYDFDEKGTALPKYEKHIPQGRKLFRTDKARGTYTGPDTGPDTDNMK